MPRTSALRLGILGCANIARQFARDVRESEAVSLTAVASRDSTKAEEFGNTFGIEARHASYDALLASDGIDAVYIPLPNSMHAAWAIRAAEAGKHILCEKPLGLNRAETEAMFAAAKAGGVMLLEAYPYWFQPQTAGLLARLGEGGIGTVRSMQASFGFTLANPDTNIRMKPDLGGGALMDAANHRRATIMGTHGTLETEYLNHTSTGPGHPFGYLPCELRMRKGTAFNIPFEAIATPTGSGFRFAAETFAAMVATRDRAKMAYYEAASHDIAATLEAIVKSARSGYPVDL